MACPRPSVKWKLEMDAYPWTKDSCHIHIRGHPASNANVLNGVFHLSKIVFLRVRGKP